MQKVGVSTTRTQLERERVSCGAVDGIGGGGELLPADNFNNHRAMDANATCRLVG